MEKYSITEITKIGIKIDTAQLDCEKELRALIPELKEAEIHTVIFLDEFAEVINKLSKQNKQENAVDILHTLREIRSDKNFEHFTLVFAGSIGLEFVIKSIDRPKLINDLYRIETPALSKEEAKQLIKQLTDTATIQLQTAVIDNLLTVVEHLLPYYIQLMLEEIDLIAREMHQPAVTKEMVEAAFDRVLKKNKNFDDWLERLRDYQAGNFPFINEILKHAAHKGKISIQEIYNKANDAKYNKGEDYMDYVEELVNDGYLVETDRYSYRFISPFLRQFWLKKISCLSWLIRQYIKTFIFISLPMQTLKKLRITFLYAFMNTKLL